MRKILRMFLLCLMTMFCGTVMAQTTIWSEDWSNWEDKAKTNLAGINPNYTFTGTVLKDGVYSSGTTIYKENLAGGDSPELLIAKSGGSFTAKVALNGATGEMNLAYKANYDRITVTISPSTVTLGEKTKTGNDIPGVICIDMVVEGSVKKLDCNNRYVLIWRTSISVY